MLYLFVVFRSSLYSHVIVSVCSLYSILINLTGNLAVTITFSPKVLEYFFLDLIEIILPLFQEHALLERAMMVPLREGVSLSQIALMCS